MNARHRAAPVAVWMALFALLTTSHATAGTLRTVVLSGNAAPGTSSGVNFSGLSFSLPVLNAAGQTAFSWRLTGTGVDSRNDRGIWSEGGGAGLALVARTGDPAPGTSSGVNFRSLSPFPVLNGAGQTAFLGLLTAMNSSGRSIWSAGGGAGLALVARTGDAVPGTSSGVNFTYFKKPVLNDAGQTAFFGQLYDTNNNSNTGIWSEGGGAGLALVARTGDPAPGTSSGVNFLFSNPPHFPILNGAGQTAFSGFLTGTGVDSSNDRGIWSEGGGAGLALVARAGDAAPGTSSGVNFSDFGHSVLNSAGQTAFSGYLTGTGVDSSNGWGIWSEGGGAGLALVARTGDAAPGTSSGVNFSSFDRPVLNGAGQTAFSGGLTGTGVDSSNDRGIWSAGGGAGLALVVRAGDPAPGTSSGVNFRSFAKSPVLNSEGQTAFVGGLTGMGVDGSNEWGIWAEDRLGALTLIARKGDQLDVDDGPGIDLRTITNFHFLSRGGNEDGRPSGFNDLGQLAFFAEFTDGSSGIFVSNLAAIPEPNSLLLGALATVGMLVQRIGGLSGRLR